MFEPKKLQTEIKQAKCSETHISYPKNLNWGSGSGSYVRFWPFLHFRQWTWGVWKPLSPTPQTYKQCQPSPIGYSPNRRSIAPGCWPARLRDGVLFLHQLPTQRSSMGPMFAHQVTMSAASRISKPCSAAWEDCNTDSTKPGTSKTLKKMTNNFLHLQKIFKLAENKKQWDHAGRYIT